MIMPHIEEESKREQYGISGINNSGMYDISLVDTMTGRVIPVQSITNSIMLAKRGEDNTNDSSVIYNHTVPNNLLGAFISTQDQGFNPKSCVEAIGLYNTDYIRQQITTLGDKQKDLSALEDMGVVDDLTFRGYIDGGASARNIFTGEAEVVTDKVEHAFKPGQTTSEIEGSMNKTHPNTGLYNRVSTSMGIGLGEAMVLNPLFQFNKRDDPRTNPIFPRIGRVYSTQIMNKWPVILFQPGRFKYNMGFTKMLGIAGGAGTTEALIRSGGDGLKNIWNKFLAIPSDIAGVVGTLGSAVFGGSKVVEFKQSINLFNNYLRMLLIDLAGIMGLYFDDSGYIGSISTLDLPNILPLKQMGSGLGRYLNEQFIPFRCQKGMTGSETFSNSTTSNPLAEELNSQAQENDEAAGEQSFSQVMKKKLLKFAGNFSDRAAVMAGRGRITLPDVFESSSFSRSITCSFEFHSPYGNEISQFENEYIQFMTILCMGMSRQTGKMTYTSPFALRIFIKNHILINCGMITDISVTRGGDNNDWCPNGHPKTIKVDVTIKDMEPNISLPVATRGPLRMALEVMFPASGMSEYLSVIGGLPIDQLTHNFRKKHLSRAWSMFTNAWKYKFDQDTMISTIANSRLAAPIIGLFAGTDLDRYNELTDVSRMTAEDSLKAVATSRFAVPGQIPAAVASTKESFAAMRNDKYAEALEKDEIAKNSRDTAYGSITG